MSVNINTAIRWQSMKRLPSILNLRGKKVCDMGAGLGFFSMKFKDLGAEVTAMDVDEEGLAYVNKTFDIKTVTKDIETEDLGDDKFDTIFVGEILEHVHDPEDLVKKVVSALNENGEIIITTPALEGSLIHSEGKALGHSEGSEKHERDGFSEAELRDLFKGANLDVIEHKFSVFLLAELFMQTTKRAYMKSKPSYHSQADVLSLTKTWKYKILKTIFPLLMLVFILEELISLKMSSKGHCHIIIGRLNENPAS